MSVHGIKNLYFERIMMKFDEIFAQYVPLYDPNAQNTGLGKQIC